MSDILTIDGTAYAVNITDLKQTSEFLDKYANRTEDGNLNRALIGVYFNYELTLGDIQDQDTMNTLWGVINAAEEFHTVILPHDNTFLTFQAYVTGTSRNLLRRRNGVNNWGGYVISFIAKAPYLTP